MDVLIYLIPAALFLSLIGLGGFFWSMRSGQFDDLDGAAMRILLEDDERTNAPNNSDIPSLLARKSS